MPNAAATRPSFTEAAYAEVEGLFANVRPGAFLDKQASKVEAYEGAIGGAQIAPVGWVKNSDEDGTGATVTIDSRGITILDGKIFLEDYGGYSVLGPAGFSGSWVAFIADGVYNGGFNAGSPGSSTAVTIVSGADSVQDYEDSLSLLVPYWIIDSVTGNAVYYQDSDSNGTFLAVSTAALNQTGTVSFFQDIPLVGGIDRMYEILINMKLMPNGLAGNAQQVELFIHERDSTHAAIGSEVAWDTIATVATNDKDYTDVPYVIRLGQLDVSNTTAYLRVRCKVTPTTGNIGSSITYFYNFGIHEDFQRSQVTFTPAGDSAALSRGASVSSKSTKLAFNTEDVPAVFSGTSALGSPQIGVYKITTHSGTISELPFVITTEGILEWGTGNAARDINLYRSGSNLLKTDDAFKSSRSVASSSAFMAEVDGDTNADRFVIKADGTHVWGSGAATPDVTLSRGAAATLSTDSRLTLTGVVSPAQIVANQNDYAPTGLATANRLRINSDAARNITGIAATGMSTGTLLCLQNIGSFTITLTHNDAASSAGNKFLCPGAANYALTSRKSIFLLYDGAAWYIIS
jgi:hypothetical protein